MRSTTLTGLLLTAVLLVSGCGAGENADAGPEPEESVVTGEPIPSEGMEPSGESTDSMAPEGTSTPDRVVPTEDDALEEPVADTLVFTAETLDGESFDGAQLAGMPTVLWFWAPWCPTCRAQVSGVEAVAAEYDRKVNIVGVGGLSDAADIRDFAQGVDGPTHLIDEEGSVWRHFGITAQSVFVMLDADGTVVSDGYLDNDGLEKAVAELAGS